MRRVRGRGVEVVDRSAKATTNLLQLSLRRGSVSHEELLEVRAIYEVQAAALAAQRATPEDLERIKLEHDGFWGRMLRIDLTRGQVDSSEIAPSLYRRYVGGRNLALHYLLRELGTPKGVVPLSTMGMLPTYNFQDGSFAEAEAVSGETMKQEIGTGSSTCHACAVACKRDVKGARGEFEVTGKWSGPEYESLCVLGPLAGVDDIYAIAQNNELCNALGLDTISTGTTIAWAVECFQRGLIDTSVTDGLELTWNDPATYSELIRKIASREGFGDVLAEGSRRAAERIGHGTGEFAMQVKGQEFPGQEPRGKWGVGLGYAVSPTGADHLQAAHDPWFDKPGDYTERYNWVELEDLSPLGLLEPVPCEDLSPAKVRLFVYLQYVWSAWA